MARLRPAEIARRAGVHKSTVSRQLRQWPSLLDEAGTVDLDEYLAARATNLDPALQTRGPAAPASLPLDTEPADLVRERTRKMAADAARAELELARRRGELLDRAAVDRAVADAFAIVRERITTAARDAVPNLARLPDELAMETHLLTALLDAMGAISVEFAADAAGRSPAAA